MFDYLFPIFGFGVVITGIVVKGLVMAADMANSQRTSETEPANVESILPNKRRFRAPAGSPLHQDPARNETRSQHAM
jgi:hypothetical protein